MSEVKNGFGKRENTEEMAYLEEKRNDSLLWVKNIASEIGNGNEPGGNNDSVQKLPTNSKEPNESQRKAIEAPIDANIRILAGPGSGKTFMIEHRYAHLVANGISTDSILVCTFSKAMADEMGKRIKNTCPSANLEQISTIHAFCYRLLCRWYPDSKYYRWQVPKDWQVKNILEDIVALSWQEKEKPNAKETFNIICQSKHLGLTNDESYNWFVSVLDQNKGTWLYNIRSKFDAWLGKSRLLTFADMLYLVEQRLKTDSTWRTMLQSKFSQVIIDESQDTSSQAMRILITISLEPGKNTVLTR